jgi:hypothetical protein
MTGVLVPELAPLFQTGQMEFADIGWPTPEEEAAQARALDAAQAPLKARTPEQIAELDSACAEARAYRLREEAQTGRRSR